MAIGFLCIIPSDDFNSVPPRTYKSVGEERNCAHMLKKADKLSFWCEGRHFYSQS